MPDLESLGLSEESVPQVDWDAPEAGKTPPPVYPGLWRLKFKVSDNQDEWFDAVEREVIKGKPETKRKFLELTYAPDVVADSQDRPVANEDGSAITLGPQRANTFLSPKMKIHQLGELIRSMGVRIEGSLLAKQENGKSVIHNTVAQLNGQATFQAEIIWRAYFKSTETTVSTHPRKKAGELPWPKDAQGQFEMLATNPQTGEKAYGYAEIARVKLPASAGSEGNIGG